MISPAIARPYIDQDALAHLVDARATGKALLLDRDGVINVNHGYVHRAEDTEWVPGIFDFCRKAARLGYLPIVVTNQAGIARGYYDEAAFLEYTAWVHREFRDRGAYLAATYYCPHHPEAVVVRYRTACKCRKPAPGMLSAAAEDFALDLPGSALVGDMPSDLEAAHAAGVGSSYKVSGDAPAFDDVLGRLVRPGDTPEG